MPAAGPSGLARCSYARPLRYSASAVPLIILVLLQLIIRPADCFVILPGIQRTVTLREILFFRRIGRTAEGDEQHQNRRRPTTPTTATGGKLSIVLQHRFASLPRLNYPDRPMLVDSLLTHAAEQPNDTAVIDDAGTYTFKQVATMATGLSLLLGFKTERPHVGLLLPAGVPFIASFYGTLLARKTVVPINFLLSDREIAHVIADSGIDTILTVTPAGWRSRE